jgi:hypothetical protein
MNDGKRVLLASADGYIDAVLRPRLLEHGFDVIGVDCGFYRDGRIGQPQRPLSVDEAAYNLTRIAILPKDL